MDKYLDVEFHNTLETNADRKVIGIKKTRECIRDDFKGFEEYYER